MSVSSNATAATAASKLAPYGEQVPYGDPNWYQEWDSPFYNESHVRLRAKVRSFVDNEITPYVHEWDERKQLPKDLLLRVAKEGWLGACVGTPWPVEYLGDNIAGGIVKASEWDAFHELIVFDELARCGSGGVAWGLAAGLTIGLPPIIHFGTAEMKRRVAGPCMRGEKVICLCITEPAAGSDVANLQCEAVKTADGKHYIVNGQKKWITNGVFSDYFTVAVRTGGPGMRGISLLLIERDMPGVETKQMNCMGVWSSGTTFINFDDVKVPVTNLIGAENQGFKSIMYNFNHERWWIVVQSTRFARVCLEDSIKFAFQRKTFGKRLIDHPVIRWKIAEMARQVDATHAWLEQVTYQMKVKTHEEQTCLGGPIALMKVQATKTFEFCAREAAQIFGGLSYTRGGKGERVERLYREVRAYAIPAGSEEIMLDLGARQAMKRAKL